MQCFYPLCFRFVPFFPRKSCSKQQKGAPCCLRFSEAHKYCEAKWAYSGPNPALAGVSDKRVRRLKLVGGLEHFLFPHILGIIIPIDSYFSEGLKPPTSKQWFSFCCPRVVFRMILSESFQRLSPKKLAIFNRWILGVTQKSTSCQYQAWNRTQNCS